MMYDLNQHYFFLNKIESRYPRNLRKRENKFTHPADTNAGATVKNPVETANSRTSQGSSQLPRRAP